MMHRQQKPKERKMGIGSQRYEGKRREKEGPGYLTKLRGEKRGTRV
jgi:hypothetical protein